VYIQLFTYTCPALTILALQCFCRTVWFCHCYPAKHLHS